MGKKRGRIYEELRRYRALYPNKAVIVVIDRAKKTREARVSMNRVVRISKNFIELEDGTMIPLHRVIRVEVSRDQKEDEDKGA